MINKKVFSMTMILMIFASAMAFSATTGTLTLIGKVNAILDIRVDAEPAAANLDLTTTKSNLAVATVVEKSNKAGGYNVALESTNATADGSSSASLKNSTSGTALEYQISYGGVPVTLTNGSATVTQSTSTTNSSGVSKVLAISYTGNDSLIEGTYTDTITLTIAAN